MKITEKLFFITAVIGLTLFSFSCIDNKKSAKNIDLIDEGVIEYTIYWPKSMRDSGFSFILPKKIIMWFNKENQRYEVNGAMDLFSIQLIKSSESDTIFTMFEAINQKIYTSNLIDEEMVWMQKSNRFHTTILKDSTKLMHNIECTKALLFDANAIVPTATIWFADKIQAKNLYTGTPLNEIPGVILEVQGRYKSELFSVKATSVEERETPPNWFTAPPDGYMLVDKAEINRRLANIFR